MQPQGPDAPVPPASSHEEEGPTQDLHARIVALESALSRVEGRLAVLEKGRAALPVRAWEDEEAEAPAEVTDGQPQPQPAGGLMGLAGIAFLVLGGAFFIRAITDSGTVPQGVGVGLGLLYAVVWMIVADRSKTGAGAVLFTLLALAIVHPLLWESTTAFKALTPGAAAWILMAAASLLMAVAWRKSLQKTAWAVTLASLVLGLALMFATKAIEAFSAVFLVFGIGMLWLTSSRRWQELRWPTALFADWAMILMAVFITANPADVPEGFRNLSVALVLLLCVGLALFYIGSFAVRILRRERAPSAFEIGQTAAVLVAGFGGAARVAHVKGFGVEPFGLGALAAALLCYGLAFAFVEKHEEGASNFAYFTSLALAFMLIGSPMALPAGALPFTYGALGLVCAGLGSRYGRNSLVAHAAVYLSAAFLVSGGLGGALKAFAASAAPQLPPMGLQAILILLAMAATHLFLVTRDGHQALPLRHRAASFTIGAWAVLGLGAFIVALGARLLGQLASDPGALATLRTVILSATTVGLAVAARKYPVSEIGWLVKPVLVLTGLKFLVEDLPKGRPLTLFLAFTCFGAALLLAPRMMKEKAPAPPAS